MPLIFDSAAEAQEAVILFRARCAEGMINIYSHHRLPFEFIGRIKSGQGGIREDEPGREEKKLSSRRLLERQ